MARPPECATMIPHTRDRASYTRSKPGRDIVTVADAPIPAAPVLTDSLIDRCGQRAAGYDRDNRFFQEDFDELRQAGYLLLAVPRELGGHGMTLA